jgi:hypothetical protein
MNAPLRMGGSYSRSGYADSRIMPPLTQAITQCGLVLISDAA